MQSDEECVGELIGNRRPIVKAGVGVAVTSQDDTIAALSEFGAASPGEGQDDIFLFEAIRATRSVIRSAMSGIDHDR